MGFFDDFVDTLDNTFNPLKNGIVDALHLDPVIKVLAPIVDPRKNGIITTFAPAYNVLNPTQNGVGKFFAPAYDVLDPTKNGFSKSASDSLIAMNKSGADTQIAWDKSLSDTQIAWDTSLNKTKNDFAPVTNFFTDMVGPFISGIFAFCKNILGALNNLLDGNGIYILGGVVVAGGAVVIYSRQNKSIT
jgi:hypothetical protein